MICVMCRQSGLVGGLTSVHFARDEMQYVIQRVPAQVCPNCNEAYVDENVAGYLLQMVEDLSATGAIESIIEYNKRA